MTFREHIKQELNMNIVSFCLLVPVEYRTLYNWFNNPKKRMLIDLIIDGIKYRKKV